MTPLFRLLLLFLVTMGLLPACKNKTPNQANYIPKTASFVLSVNTGSLKDKLQQSEASIENILSNMSGSDTSLTRGKQEWEALKNSGINLEESIYLWVKQNEGANLNDAAGTMPVTGAVAVLKDEDKFEAYVKSKIPGAAVKKEEKFSYVQKGDNNLVAWSDKVIVLLTQQNQFGYTTDYDSLTSSFLPPQAPKTSVTGNLPAEAKAIFTQKESESISSISQFADLAQEKADATIWVNTGAGLKNLTLPMPKMKELAENNFTAATLQFAEGKVVVNSKSYAGKALQNILKEYAGPEVNLSLVQQYPSPNVNGYLVFAFDPQIFSAIVKYMEVGALADGFVTRFMGRQYTLQQALSAFKGDIAVVVSDLAPVNAAGPPPANTPGNVPRGKVIFTATVGNAAEMNNLMDRLVAINMLEKQNGLYRPQGVPETFGLAARLTGQQLTIASDTGILNAYMNNKAGNNNLVTDGLKGKAASGYFNVESVLDAFSVSSTQNANADSIIPYARQTFKDIKAYANNFNGNYTEGHFELRLKNEKENSLSSLLWFISKSSDAARTNRQVNMPSL